MPLASLAWWTRHRLELGERGEGERGLGGRAGCGLVGGGVVWLARVAGG